MTSPVIIKSIALPKATLNTGMVSPGCPNPFVPPKPKVSLPKANSPIKDHFMMWWMTTGHKVPFQTSPSDSHGAFLLTLQYCRRCCCCSLFRYALYIFWDNWARLVDKLLPWMATDILAVPLRKAPGPSVCPLAWRREECVSLYGHHDKYSAHFALFSIFF